MRWSMMALLIAACSTTEAPPTSEADVQVEHVGPTTDKGTSVPATITAALGKNESVVRVDLEQPGEAVTVEIWGATGLEVSSSKLAWRGDLEAGTKSFVVTHAGSGDLAVRIEGAFGGSRRNKVQSFTVGNRARTVVPTSPGANPIRGWAATPN